MLENAYLSQPFDLKEFLKSLRNEEENEVFQNALAKISKSSVLKSKGLFQNLAEKLKVVRVFDRQVLQDKYNRLLEKDDEIIRKFKE